MGWSEQKSRFRLGQTDCMLRELNRAGRGRRVNSWVGGQRRKGEWVGRVEEDSTEEVTTPLPP